MELPRSTQAMNIFQRILLAAAGCGLSLDSAHAQATSWRFYRPTNTGIQGDFNSAIFIDSDRNPWIGGYDAAFEEGGIAKFVHAENRWINVSNVDYPVIGHPNDIGVVRVTDMVSDGLGNLWIGTWRGALAMNLAQGPDSLVRYGPGNSGLPGGVTTDIALAPHGTLWFSASSASWGAGGLTRYNPSTNVWTHFANHGGQKIAVQPKSSGGYYVWTDIEGFSGMQRFDSTSQTWTTFGFADGAPADLVSLDSVDAAGNTWMMRWKGVQGEQRLDCLLANGSWLSPALPPVQPLVPVAALRAFDNLQALMVDGFGVLHRFDGSGWIDLGPVPHDGFIDDLDIDDQGTVWLCGEGTGGVLRRDAVSGFWQRYRVTNTSQFDFFSNDLAVDGSSGDVYACGNAASGVGGMSQFDGERWHSFVNDLGYGLSKPWPFTFTDNSEAVYVRPSTGHVVANPLNGFTHEFDGSQWTALPGGFDQIEQYVEDSSGRLWAMGHYGGMGFFQSGGFTVVDSGGWSGKLQVDPDRPGTVWANEDWKILRTDGVYSFSRSMDDFPELAPASSTFGGLAADRNGVAWVGCTLQGGPGGIGGALLRIDADTGDYSVLKSFEGWGLPGQFVYPLRVTADGRLWMIYEGGQFPNFERGLCWYDGTQVGVFPAPPNGEFTWGGLPHASIDDLEVKPIVGGYELWMSCLSRGIAVLTVLDPANVSALGCGNNPSGSLSSTGFPAIGGSFSLEVDNPLGSQGPGSLPFLALSTNNLASPCGIALPGWNMDTTKLAGELLVGAPYFYLQAGPLWSGTGTPVAFDLFLPSKPAAIGAEFYAQGALLNGAGMGPLVGLTEALTLRVGL